MLNTTKTKVIDITGNRECNITEFLHYLETGRYKEKITMRKKIEFALSYLFRKLAEFILR